jgi:hypothetical protein
MLKDREFATQCSKHRRSDVYRFLLQELRFSVRLDTLMASLAVYLFGAAIGNWLFLCGRRHSIG